MIDYKEFENFCQNNKLNLIDFNNKKIINLKKEY